MQAGTSMIRVPEGNAYFQSGMLCSCLRKGGTCGSRTTWHNHTQSFVGRQPSFHRCHLVNLMTRCYAEVCLVVYWLTPSSSASTPQCHMIWLWEHCNFYKYTALIYTKTRWKSMENSAPDCSGTHFCLIFHYDSNKKWTIWQYYRQEKFYLKSFWSFSKSLFHLHFLSGVSPFEGPTQWPLLWTSTQGRHIHYVSYSWRGDKPYSVCCCSIGATSP